MNLLDLFSGIGAFSIGLERAGFRTVAFCETNQFSRQVLAKHWPKVPCYGEIEKLTAKRIAADGIQVDAICAGWPCQDISNAGAGAGIDGERSGLWRHVARLVGELQPRYVVLENVAALLSRGLGTVLGDLAQIGYDAEWHCIPASAVGAPHIRDRIWIVAYPARDGRRWPRIGTKHGRGRGGRRIEQRTHEEETEPRDVANPNGGRWGKQRHVGKADTRTRAGRQLEQRGAELANPERSGRKTRGGHGARSPQDNERQRRSGDGSGANAVRQPGSPRLQIRAWTLAKWAHDATTGTGWWAAEPNVGRMVDGRAAVVDGVGRIPTGTKNKKTAGRRKRLIAIGNSLVPIIPQIIGTAIFEYEEAEAKVNHGA